MKLLFLKLIQNSGKYEQILLKPSYIIRFFFKHYSYKKKSVITNSLVYQKYWKHICTFLKSQGCFLQKELIFYNNLFDM